MNLAEYIVRVLGLVLEGGGDLSFGTSNVVWLLTDLLQVLLRLFLVLQKDLGVLGELLALAFDVDCSAEKVIVLIGTVHRTLIDGVPELDNDHALRLPSLVEGVTLRRDDEDAPDMMHVAHVFADQRGDLSEDFVFLDEVSERGPPALLMSLWIVLSSPVSCLVHDDACSRSALDELIFLRH